MLMRMLKDLLAGGRRVPATMDPAGAALVARLDAICAALQSGNRDRAAAIAAETLNVASKNPLALGTLALTGGLERAMRSYAEITKAGLESKLAVRAWEELGYCHSLRGDTGQAVAAFDRALAEGRGPRYGNFDRLYHQGLASTQTWDSPRRRQRFFHLVDFAAQCAALEGDSAECGCWRGLSSYLICGTFRQLDPGFTGRGYHVFDSFQGLSKPAPQDGGTGQPGQFAASLEDVRRNLADFPEIAFHPGWIPASFAGLPERRYRFVHVDVDLFDPTDGAIRYFVPRLVPGGILVCDDFNWPGARKAIEDYCAGAGLSFSITESSQAVIRAA